MKKQFLLIVLGLIGCRESLSEKEKPSDLISVDSSIVKDSTASNFNAEDEHALSRPSNDLLTIVSVLELAGLFADTNRILKVPYYSRTVKKSQIFMDHDIPFYKMYKPSNLVFLFINFRVEKASNTLLGSDFRAQQLKDACSQVENITGYYFNKKVPEELQTDGFIEEWEFNSALEAADAQAELTFVKDLNSKPYYFIYVNSYAHIFRKENRLYTFYSRATWDSRLFEGLYEMIIRKIDADSWTNLKGDLVEKLVEN
jgi:hypothetical protein